jgi:uncharacterized membrane protein
LRIEALFTLALALGGCAAGSGSLAEVDPAAVPTNPTWSSHARQILDMYCAGCHSKDALPGELEGFGYDTCESAKREWHETYEVTFTERSMPPPTGFPMPSVARETLQRWYDEGASCE